MRPQSRVARRSGDSRGITHLLCLAGRGVVAAFLGCVLAGILASPAGAAATSEQCSKLLASISTQPNPDPSTLPAECREQFEQQQGQSPSPTPTASPSPSASSTPTVGSRTEESEEPKVFKDVVPETSSEEWGMDAGRSADELLAELDKALGSSPKTLDTGFATPYAVSWGIGLVLMAFVITVTAGQAGGGPERRAQLQSAGWRAWTYYPAILVAPTVAYQLYAMAGHLAGWFGGQGETARALVFRLVQQRLWEASAPAMLLSGGSLLALFILGLIVIFAVLTLLEVVLAQYGLFLLLCFVPPMAALAIHPRFRPALSRLIGAIIGALLVPPVLQFGFWVSMSIASDTLKAERLNKETTLHAFALVLACLIVASVVPLLMALLMPKIVAGVTGSEDFSGTRRGLGDLGRGARMEGRMAADRLSRSSGRGARPRMPGSATGQAAASVAKNASAGAVTKAAAAATGPAAPVTAAGAAAVQAGVGAMRSAYNSAKSKLGGGAGKGGGTSSGSGVGGAGGVGRVPTAPASGSTRPAASDGAGQGGSRQSAQPASSPPAAQTPAGVGGSRGPSFRPPSDGAR